MFKQNEEQTENSVTDIQITMQCASHTNKPMFLYILFYIYNLIVIFYNYSLGKSKVFS